MNYDLNTDQGMANAVAWTRNLIGLVRDDGVWIVPRSGTRIKINHTRKSAEITGPEADTFHKVFAAMGWNTKDLTCTSSST